MSRNFIVIDTETAPTIANKDYPVAATSRVYDLGYIVANRNGEILEKRSFIISETFFKDEWMNSAYYAEKLPQYYAGMGTEWQVTSFLAAYRQFRADVERYRVKDVWAFNARFDDSVLNATIRAFSNGFKQTFIPEKCQVRDIWDFAGSTICNTKKFVEWCFENGKLTAKGNPSTSAETVYSYLINKLDFTERHTALNDCEIELAILLACFKRKQKARHSKGQGWRDAYKIAQEVKGA